MTVHLGTMAGQPHGQLDGFTLRALRAQAPTTLRHLYSTEWRELSIDKASGSTLLVVSDEHAEGCERLSSKATRAELEAKVSGHGRRRT